APGPSRTGDYSFASLGQLAGLALMFCGFTLPSRAPAPRRPPQPHAAQPATTAQMIRSDIHRQARQIANSELGRCPPLRALPAEEALLVTEAVRKVAAAVADCLLA